MKVKTERTSYEVSKCPVEQPSIGQLFSTHASEEVTVCARVSKAPSESAKMKLISGCRSVRTTTGRLKVKKFLKGRVLGHELQRELIEEQS